MVLRHEKKVHFEYISFPKFWVWKHHPKKEVMKCLKDHHGQCSCFFQFFRPDTRSVWKIDKQSKPPKINIVLAPENRPLEIGDSYWKAIIFRVFRSGRFSWFFILLGPSIWRFLLESHPFRAFSVGFQVEALIHKLSGGMGKIKPSQWSHLSGLQRVMVTGGLQQSSLCFLLGILWHEHQHWHYHNINNNDTENDNEW